MHGQIEGPALQPRGRLEAGLSRLFACEIGAGGDEL